MIPLARLLYTITYIAKTQLVIEYLPNLFRLAFHVNEVVVMVLQRGGDHVEEEEQP